MVHKWLAQVLLVLMCFGIFMGARRANRQLETYLEDGIFTPQLPEKKAEGWHEWIENLKTRSPLPLHLLPSPHSLQGTNHREDIDSSIHPSDTRGDPSQRLLLLAGPLKRYETSLDHYGLAPMMFLAVSSPEIHVLWLQQCKHDGEPYPHRFFHERSIPLASAAMYPIPIPTNT